MKSDDLRAMGLWERSWSAILCRWNRRPTGSIARRCSRSTSQLPRASIVRWTSWSKRPDARVASLPTF